MVIVIGNYWSHVMTMCPVMSMFSHITMTGVKMMLDMAGAAKVQQSVE